MMSDWNWKKWFSNQRQKSAVVCVPIVAKKHNDIVLMLSKRLPRLCKGLADCYVVEIKGDDFEILRSQKEYSDKFHSVTVFAHPDDSFENFAVDVGPSSETPVLPPEWWSKSPPESNMMVAHVCQGFRIMTALQWAKVFPNWVSYRANVDAFLVGEDDDLLWASVAKAIIAAAAKSQKPSALKNRIRAIYYDKFAELSERGRPKDEVHMMHFQAAMDSLVSSDEVQR